MSNSSLLYSMQHKALRCPKVSVIVPIYNEEERLERCLDSIVNQTLKDIEIILVDDGSTDRSPEIIASYAARDSRVLVIRKKNEGRVQARQDGIVRSSGEYVGFVDADDYVDLSTYEKAYACAKRQDADTVIFRTKRILHNVKYPVTDRVHAPRARAVQRWLNKSPQKRFVMPPNVKGYLVTRIYRRSLFPFENEFPEITFFLEDFVASIQIFHRCTSIAVLQESLYFYDLTSMTPTRFLDKQHNIVIFDQLCCAIMCIRRWCITHGISLKYARTLLSVKDYIYAQYALKKYARDTIRSFLPILKKYYHIWWYVWGVSVQALPLKYLCSLCFRAYFEGRISLDSQSLKIRCALFSLFSMFMAPIRIVKMFHRIIQNARRA